MAGIKTTNCDGESCVVKQHILNLETLNPLIPQVQYAVRGPVVIRAVEIIKELNEGKKRQYKYVIRCNIGDAHAMGQVPLTFIRQVLAGVSYPQVVQTEDLFPNDVKDRIKHMLSVCGGGSIGSYTASMGIDSIRQDVAKFIANRDGFPSSASDVFLSTGASSAIKTILSLFISGQLGKLRTGIMIPIPQYPLYTATLAEYDILPIGYYLNEETNWGIDQFELKRALEASKASCVPRAIVVINPGNPTGQVLKKEDIKNIIKFAWDEKLVILADEVYQHNIYAPGCEFHSFKKVINEMGSPYNKMELASFFSVSKGYMGECGIRGGYGEIYNFNPEVMKELAKLLTAGLCASSTSQIVMDTVVNPPKKGDVSYELFETEKAAVLNDLSLKASLIHDGLNELENITCNVIQGAMYAFPRLHLPQKAIEEAKQRGQHPDEFYCFQLLEEAGVCVVPGSGFGQKDGTHHFRTTILPYKELMTEFLERVGKFNSQFMKLYK